MRQWSLQTLHLARPSLSPPPGLSPRRNKGKITEKMMWNALIQKQYILNPVDQLILIKHNKAIKYKLYKKLQSDRSAGQSSITANQSPATETRTETVTKTKAMLVQGYFSNHLQTHNGRFSTGPLIFQCAGVKNYLQSELHLMLALN